MALYIKRTVPPFVRNKRKAMGLTQSQFADMFGLKHPAISKWESGETAPGLEILLKILFLELKKGVPKH